MLAVSFLPLATLPEAAAEPAWKSGQLPPFDPVLGLGGSGVSFLDVPGERQGPSLVERTGGILPPMPQGGPGAMVDTPGPARGVNTNENTLGWTTTATDLDRWVWDTETSSNPLDFEINMGKLVVKDKIAAEKDYIFEYAFNVVAWFSFDADGVFDPIPNQNQNGQGDDPCPSDPSWKLFDFKVNGQLVRTVEGWKITNCTPGGPESARSFEIKPDPAYPDDPPYWLRIPKAIMKEGRNTVSFTLYDFYPQLPAHNPFHSAANDGWEMYIDWAAIELAAPPLILSHGWTYEWNPGPVAVNSHWLSTLKANILKAFRDATGQNPWLWASDTPLGGGIWMNTYDRKQDFRISANELLVTTNGVHSLLGFNGKGWMHGHSMGGLVSRWYLEMRGGNDKIERVGFTATPHLGSYAAHLYTYGFWLGYEANDEDYTATWFNLVPFLGPKVWSGWRDWWNVGAWEWKDGPGHGRDHLADFMLKPGNPILNQLNGAFPAAGVDYFVVRGDWSPGFNLSGVVIPGDVVVTLNSAILGGAISKYRTLNEQHEEVPAREEAAIWLFRHYANVDLDTGLPNSGGASGSWGASAPVVNAYDAETSLFRSESAAGMAFIGPGDVAAGPYERPCTLDAVPHAKLGFLVNPNEAPIGLEVEAPDGTIYAAEDAGTVPGLTYTDVEVFPFRFVLFGIDDPAPGTWTLRLQPEEAPPMEGMPVYVTCALDSPVAMTTAADAARYLPGASAALTATLTDGGAPLPGATVTATRLTADGAPVSLDLLDDGSHADGAAGDGVYGTTFDVGDADTTHRFDVRAEGTGSTGAFARSGALEFSVGGIADLAISAADLAGAPLDAWGGDPIELSATVHSVGERGAAGSIGVSFYDGDPGAGGAFLGRVADDAGLALGESRTFVLDALAPAHAMDLHVLVDAAALELDARNNAASAPMPFVATPQTLATITGPAGENGWLQGPATVTLAPFDGSVAAYASTVYMLDGGPATTYTGPFMVDAEGDHLLEYLSTDSLGRVEPLRTARVKVDTALPEAALLNPVAHNLHVLDASVANPQGFTAVAGLVDVVVAASDAASGVARVRVRVDDRVVGDATLGADGRFHLLWDSTATSLGNHDLHWEARDAAGFAVAGTQHVFVLASRSAQVDHDVGDTIARLTPGGA